MNNAPFPSGSRLAAYVRDSGGETKDLSTTHQEIVIREFPLNHGLMLTVVYKANSVYGVMKNAMDDKKKFNISSRMVYQNLCPYGNGIPVWGRTPVLELAPPAWR